MTTIVNTLKQYPVGFTWAEHKAAGLSGGTDYIVPAGTPIRSGVAGTAKYLGRMADGNYMVGITYATGRSINYRELGGLSGSFPRKVAIDTIIGYADNLKWPHVDATILGIRRQFEPLVTKTTSIASVGSVTTVKPPASTTPNKKVFGMIKLFVPTTNGTDAGLKLSLGAGQMYTFNDIGGDAALMADSPAETTAQFLYGAPDTAHTAAFWIEAVKVARAAAKL